MPISFEKYLLKKGCSNSTIKSYQLSVEIFNRWAKDKLPDPHFATYNDLLEYTSHLRKRNLQPTTIKGYFKGLFHYFNHLIQQQQASENPVRYLNLQGKQIRTQYPILSSSQLTGLHTNFQIKGKRQTKASSLASAHCKKITVGFMVFQALDTHALQSLTIEDLNLTKGTIHIPSSRIQAERILTLHSAQIMELYHYLDLVRPELLQHFTPNNPDKLLIFGKGDHAHVNSHGRLIQRLKQQEPALISGRQIKASLITHWLRQYNLREVQYMAGHRHVKNTEAYKRDDIEGLQLDIDRFHPFK